MPDGNRVALTEVALSIWADCTNAGQPFQAALLAVYLSGLQHGAALSPQTKQEEK